MGKPCFSIAMGPPVRSREGMARQGGFGDAGYVQKSSGRAERELWMASPEYRNMGPGPPRSALSFFEWLFLITQGEMADSETVFR